MKCHLSSDSVGAPVGLPARARGRSIWEIGGICLLLLSMGCGSLPSVSSRPAKGLTHPNQAPVWVHEFAAPDNNLYGVGTGANLELATRSALIEVAAGLSVSVAQELTLDTSQVGERSQQRFRHQLDSAVGRTNFSEWKRIESAEVAGLYYALVQVDRQRLIGDLRSELESLEASLLGRLDPAPPTSSLRFWAAYRDSGMEIERVEEISVILPGIDRSFDASSSRRRLRAWRDRYELVLAEVVFAVASRDQMGEVAAVVETLLVDARLPVHTQHSCQIGRDVCIEVTGSVTSRQIGGNHVSVINSSWSLHDENGALISSMPHHFTGNSMLSRREAEQDARRRMYEALERSGIESALGL